MSDSAVSEEQPDDYEVQVRARRFDRGEERDGIPAYLLEQRVTGHDSYRPAQLIRSSGEPLRVRVLTLDDITIVYPLSPNVDLPEEWEGTLRLSPGRRGPRMPDDLASALASAGVDPEGLDDAQRRHLIGFVTEARPGPTRDARIAAAVEAARPR